MKTISQYREDISRLMKKVGDIDARCVNENRDLSEEELALKNEILDGVDELRRMVNTLERQERLQADLEKPQERETVEKSKKKFDMSSLEATEDRSKKDRFSTLGEQMAAIMRAASPGGNIDPRLYRAASGLSTTVPSDGGLRVYA